MHDGNENEPVRAYWFGYCLDYENMMVWIFLKDQRVAALSVAQINFTSLGFQTVCNIFH